MLKIIFSVGLILPLTVSATAQVDTLWFSLSNVLNITQSGQIITANIQGDGIKEFIISSNNNIYIYDSNNGNLIWTSPPLLSSYTRPQPNDFFDLNHDGDLDITIRDSLVRIFDVMHKQLLWTSPPIPSSLSICSTIGDLNSDGSDDIIVAHRESHLGDIADDTCWINVYDGPSFNSGASFFFLVPGNEHQNYYRKEFPFSMAVIDLTGSTGLERKLYVFLETSTWDYFEDGYYNITTSTSDGSIAIIEPATFETTIIDSGGKVELYLIYQLDNVTSLCAVTSDYTRIGGNILRSFQGQKSLIRITANGLNDFDQLWSVYNSEHYWEEHYKYVVGEIDPENPGDEMFFARPDSNILISFPGMTRIWAQARPVYLAEELSLFHSNSLFGSPQNFTRTSAMLIDGTSGLQSAVSIQGSLQSTYVDELDSDGEDEFFKFISATQIGIYHAIPYSVGVEENPNHLPKSFRLHANYPNPFNTLTIISYDLAKEADVSLEIFDLLGRKVATLTEGMQEAGTHKAKWDGSGVSSGLYFYRLRAGDYSDIKKMTLLK
jgi:hypothetical protein